MIRNRFPTLLQRLFIGMLLAALWGVFPAPGSATDLPPAVLMYLREKDPHVKVRFDGLITFPEGQVYLPVLPQDPAMPRNPGQVLHEEPKDTTFPDLVQFDNNLFLIRMVNTSSGKLALAKLDVYPIELKEGILPQDLLLPPNLFIPTELKVILGDLPYDPKSGAVDTPHTAEAIAMKTFDTVDQLPVEKTLYLNDLDHQMLVAVDPNLEVKREEIRLDCVGSSLAADPDGRSVYVTCLTTDELVVIDTHSNLIKTRIPVGSKPTGVLLLPDLSKLVVSHRYSNFLSMINAQDLLPGSKILLPGNGGEMAYDEATQMLYISDYTAEKLYELDMNTQKVVRMLPAMKNISAMWVDRRNPERPQIWLASRTMNKVMMTDLRSGEPQSMIEVGKKPVAFAPLGDTLYVVSASEDRLDVIDMNQRQLGDPIAIAPGAFPTALSISKSDQRAYVTAAGINSLYVVDLKTRSVEKAIPLEIRGMGIALVGGGPAKGALEMQEIKLSPAYQARQRSIDVDAEVKKEGNNTVAPSVEDLNPNALEPSQELIPLEIPSAPKGDS